MLLVRAFVFGILLHSSLFAATVATFYGPLEVDEPVLLELIESPTFQRLKSIHQYGIAYYLDFPEEYNRYDHSMGVFAILRLKGASLEEQIAGLLHDVSHTAFSHVGDWIYGQEHTDGDYQTSVHEGFLKKYGLGEILAKYDLEAAQVMPLESLFPMLEQKGPTLCADRIDYNIQGAYYQGYITHAEAIEILGDLQYIDGDWVSTRPDLMAKIGSFSLYMSSECWGSATNHFTSRWFANAILRGVALGLLTYEDINFGIDDTIWSVLNESPDPQIRRWMRMVMNSANHFSPVPVSQADEVIRSKFRGIDPWILVEGGKIRLTELDPVYRVAYDTLKKLMAEGWGVRFH